MTAASTAMRPPSIAMSIPMTMAITATSIRLPVGATGPLKNKPRRCRIWSEDRMSVRGFPFFLFSHPWRDDLRRGAAPETVNGKNR